MCEIFVDRKFIAHFVRSQVTELREDRLFMFEDEAAWNLSKKRSFGQFLICIQIQDSDSNPHPDPKLSSSRIRIRNFCFGSATLVFYSYITMGSIRSKDITAGAVQVHPELSFDVFQIKSQLLLVILALLDPDPYSQCGSGSSRPKWMRIRADPDP